MSGNSFVNIAGAAGNAKPDHAQYQGTERHSQVDGAAATASAEWRGAGRRERLQRSDKINIVGGVAFGQDPPPLPTTNPLAPLLAAPGGIVAEGTDDRWGEVLTGDTLISMVAAAIDRWPRPA